MQPPERHEVDQGRKEDKDDDQAPVPAARFTPDEEAVSFMRSVCPFQLAILPDKHSLGTPATIESAENGSKPPLWLRPVLASHWRVR